MRAARLLGQLEAVAEKLGIQIVNESLFPSRSGFCRVGDRYFLFIDSDLKEEEQIPVFLSAISSFPLDHLHMLPRVRRALEAHRAKSRAQIP